MSERSDEEGSVGSETQQMPNDMKYSSAESAAKDKLYEPKKKPKVIRVLTVMAYVFSVSLAAIMLSLYYVFLWDPKVPSAGRGPMALRDPEPHDVIRNISCLHLSTQGDIEALPQKQDVETNTMKMEYSKKTTPIPLVSLLAQSQPRQEPSTTSNQQTSTNITPRKLLGT